MAAPDAPAAAILWSVPMYEAVHPEDKEAPDIPPMLPSNSVCPDIRRQDLPDFFRQVKFARPIVLVDEATKQGEPQSEPQQAQLYYTVRCWWANPAHRGLPSTAPAHQRWLDELGEIYDSAPVGWFTKTLGSEAVGVAEAQPQQQQPKKRKRRAQGDTLSVLMKERDKRQHNKKRRQAAVIAEARAAEQAAAEQAHEAAEEEDPEATQIDASQYMMTAEEQPFSMIAVC